MGGRLVTSHCYTSEGIRHAIAGGVGGIEHGNLLDKQTAKLMAETGTYLTPTLAVHTVGGDLALAFPCAVADNGCHDRRR